MRFGTPTKHPRCHRASEEMEGVKAARAAVSARARAAETTETKKAAGARVAVVRAAALLAEVG